MNVLIIASHKYGAPAQVVVTRQTDTLLCGRLPEQGNQPVSIQKRHINYLGDQPVVHEQNIQIERD